MTEGMKRLLVLTLLGLALSACVVTPVPATTATPPVGVTPTVATPTGQACNPGDQIPFVYHDYRLTKVSDCSHVVGKVNALRTEADGDWHAGLQCANAACQSLMTQGNTDYQHGDLVVEWICANPITQADAVQPCAADPDPIKNVPAIGACVWIDGRGVFDGIHKWGEVHPVGAWGAEPNGCAGMQQKIYTLDAEQDDGE